MKEEDTEVDKTQVICPPVFYAAANGKRKVTLFLILQPTTNFDIKDNFNNTLEDILKLENQKDLIRVLYEHNPQRKLDLQQKGRKKYAITIGQIYNDFSTEIDFYKVVEKFKGMGYEGLILFDKSKEEIVKELCSFYECIKDEYCKIVITILGQGGTINNDRYYEAKNQELLNINEISNLFTKLPFVELIMILDVCRKEIKLSKDQKDTISYVSKDKEYFVFPVNTISTCADNESVVRSDGRSLALNILLPEIKKGKSVDKSYQKMFQIIEYKNILNYCTSPTFEMNGKSLEF